MVKVKKSAKLFAILQLLFFCLSVHAGYFKTVSLDGVPSASSTTPELILRYINEYRARKHLAPLKMNSLISAQAAKHSNDMARKAVPFGHQSYNQRFKAVYKGISECRSAAENVAFYRVNAKKLVEAWLSSPGHRRNIEGNYNLTGIGIAYGKKGMAYYTQIFARSTDKKYA